MYFLWKDILKDTVREENIRIKLPRRPDTTFILIPHSNNNVA